MTEAADVLDKWASLIEDSKVPCDEVEQAFLDLAAEVRALRERLAKLESEKRLASDWECWNCGRMNPGTMPHCPCMEET